MQLKTNKKYIVEFEKTVALAVTSFMLIMTLLVSAIVSQSFGEDVEYTKPALLSQIDNGPEKFDDKSKKWYTKDPNVDIFYIQNGLELSYLANLVNGDATDESGAKINQVDFTGKTIILVGSVRNSTTTPTTPTTQTEDTGDTQQDVDTDTPTQIDDSVDNSDNAQQDVENNSQAENDTSVDNSDDTQQDVENNSQAENDTSVDNSDDTQQDVENNSQAENDTSVDNSDDTQQDVENDSQAENDTSVDNSDDTQQDVENDLPVETDTTIDNSDDTQQDTTAEIAPITDNQDNSNNIIDIVNAGAILYQTDANGNVSYTTCDSGNVKKYWTPIGKDSFHKFNGTIKTETNKPMKVYNLCGYLNDEYKNDSFGLFGYLGDSAVVENIDLVDMQIYLDSNNKTTQHIGGIAGVISSKTTITNCSATGIKTGLRTKNALGTALSTSYYVPEFTIKSGKTDTRMGGLVGYISDGATINNTDLNDISNCTFNGKLSSKSTYGTGGIVGRIETNKTIDNCNVGTNSETDYGYYSEVANGSFVIELTKSKDKDVITSVGGIVGRITRSSLNSALYPDYVKISNIAQEKNNNVYITSTSSLSMTGGVVGSSGCKKIEINNIGNVNFKLHTTINSLVYGSNGVTNTEEEKVGGVGGVIGYSGVVGKDKNPGSCITDIKNCNVQFDADIGVYKPTNSNILPNLNLYVGGIVGRADYQRITNASISQITVDNCNVTNSHIANNINPSLCSLTMGGIAGGINLNSGSVANSNSKISNCTVDGFYFTTDGLTGGIVGVGSTDSKYCSIGVSSIENCTIKNVTMTSATNTTDCGHYMRSGGVCPTMGSDCTVKNTNVSNLTFNYVGLYNGNIMSELGGITGYMNGGTITDCTANTNFNVGITANATDVLSAGGIVGKIIGSKDTIIKNCATIADFKWTTSVNTISYTGNDNAAAVGGIAGRVINNTADKLSITNCISSGTIDTTTTNPIEKKSSSVGGIAGIFEENSKYILNDCYSSMSLGGNQQDTIGGIVGYSGVYNDVANLVSNCYFEGNLLNPNSGSIIGLLWNPTEFKSCGYNEQLSPNRLLVNLKSNEYSTTKLENKDIKNSLLQTLYSNLTGDTLKAYYNAITSVPITLGTTNENVFAVSSDVAISNNFINKNTGDTTPIIIADKSTQTVELQKSFDNITLNRKIKFIHTMNVGQNGTTSPFTISTVEDLNNMRDYVALGGGYIGCQFNLINDFDASNFTTSIGNSYIDFIKFIGTKDYDTTLDYPFYGDFNGNKKTITLNQIAKSNIITEINTSSSTSSKPSPYSRYSGLFGYCAYGTIKDFNIVYESSDTLKIETKYFGGLAGLAHYEYFKNVTVKAINGISSTYTGDYTGTARNGGLVGYTNCTIFVQSSFTGKILSASNTGGLVGYSDNIQQSTLIGKKAGSSNVQFIKCYVYGDVLGGAFNPDSYIPKPENNSQNIGGIVGYQTIDGKNSVVDQSFFFGNVIGGINVGGLIGSASTSTSGAINTSYANANVYANDYAGGMIGLIVNPMSESIGSDDEIMVKNSYFVGQVECPKIFGAITGSIALYSDFFYDKQVAGEIAITGKIDAEKDSATGLTGDDLCVKALLNFTPDSTKTHYPQINYFKDSDISKLSTLRLYQFYNSDTAHSLKAGDKITTNVATIDYDITGQSATKDGTTIKPTASANNSATFTITAKYNELNGYNLIRKEKVIVVPFTTGDGTKDSPFEIPDVATLVAFRNYINNYYGGNGQYFALTMQDTNDISIYDLSSEENTDKDGRVTTEWNTPIGTPTQAFQGYFMGQNKLITNFYATDGYDIKLTVGQYQYYYKYAGLFGYVKGGTIENLTVEGGIKLSSNYTVYAGVVAGFAENSTINNVTVRTVGDSIAGKNVWNDITKKKIDVTSNSTSNIYVGSLCGQMLGNADVNDIFVYSDITTSKGTGNNNIYVGSVIGQINATSEKTDSTCKANIKNIISKSDILAKGEAKTKIGGLIGSVVGKSNSDSTATISNSAYYGTGTLENGVIGGIVGQLNIYINVALENCYSTATLKNSITNNSDIYMAGLIGDSLQSDKLSLKNCIFGGELELVSSNSTSQIKGLVANTNSKKPNIFNECYFDISKNYDLPKEHNYYENYNNMTINIGKTTADLIGDNGQYPAPTGLTKNFGHSTNENDVNKVIEGNSIAMNVVRTTKAKKDSQSNLGIGASSVYVAFPKYDNNYGTKELGKVQLSYPTSNTANTKYSHDSKRRIESTDNSSTSDESNLVTVQIVKMNGETDDFSGYGKTFTYYPSIESTGRADSSYFIADPEESSHNFYTCDQLMGLDCIVERNNSTNYQDVVGGRFYDFTNQKATDITFNLQKDLDYSIANRGNYIISNPYNYDSTIIGNSSNAFSGTLDGKYHIVSGLTITSGEDCVGLFANLNSATIKNLGITDSYLRSTAQSGTLGIFAASATNSTIENSFSSARVETDSTTLNNLSIGGFVGQVYGTSIISNCYFTGSIGVRATDSSSYPAITVTGTLSSGGFVGLVNDNANLTFKNKCYVATYILFGNCGSYVGTNSGNLTIENTCQIDNKACGEIKVVGNGTPSSYTPTAMIVTGGLYPQLTGFDYDTNDKAKSSIVALTYDLSAESFNNGKIDDSINATFSNGSYLDYWYKTKDSSNKEITITNSVVTVDSGLTINSDKEIVRKDSGINSIIVNVGESKRLVTVNLRWWYDDYTTDTSGNKIYTIQHLSELNELADIVAGNKVSTQYNRHPETEQVRDATFENATIQLGENIELNKDDTNEFLNIVGTKETSTTKDFENKFKGTFDGNGCSIINANFNSTNGKVGLFATLENTATVKNLSFAGSTTITIPEDETNTVYTGLIASENNGTVENCFNASKVELTNNSTTNVNVTAGGLVGKNTSNIHDCYNMNTVSATTPNMSIAGIVGENSGNVQYCYNTGIISGNVPKSTGDKTTTIVAGIVAKNSGTVDECYNAGVLLNYKDDKNSLSPIAIGGTVTHCFFDGQIFIMKTDDYVFDSSMSGKEYNNSGIIIYSTKDMCKNNTPNSTTLTSDHWVFKSGYYPQLKSQATNEKPLNKAMSPLSTLATIVSKGDSTKATFDNFSKLTLDELKDLHSFVTKKSAGSFTNDWFVDVNGDTFVQFTVGDYAEYIRNTYFTNEQTYKIRYKFDFNELTKDTSESKLRTPLYGSDNCFILNSGDNTTLDSTTKGSGTAGDPYIINTVTDFNNFAIYVNAGGATYNRYFQLSSNLNFIGQTYTPIGTEAHPFKGKFIGDGYTISNIKYTVDDNIEYAGLFGYTDKSSLISLVKLDHCNFTSENTHNGDVTIGAIVGYTVGRVTNCIVQNSIVTVYSPLNGGSMTAGGIVGEIGTDISDKGVVSSGSLDSSYARFTGNSTKSVFQSYVKNTTTYYGGILVGKCSGIINGCYHTCQYFTPTKEDDYKDLAPHYVLVGYLSNTENLKNVFYDTDSSDFIKQGFKLYSYSNNNSTIAYKVAQTDDNIGIAREQLKRLETSYEDSYSLQLSQDLYLGTYSMRKLQYHTSTVTDDNGNDGFPILTAFDLAQYNFESFDTSKIILSMQNEGSSKVQLMNALTSYSTASFPIYAPILSKEHLTVNVISLPYNIDYNVSSVAYGYNSDDEKHLKYTILNGMYTNNSNKEILNSTVDDDKKNILYVDDDKSYNYNKNTIQNFEGDNIYGTVPIRTIVSTPDTAVLPKMCSKIYAYITLVKNTNHNGTWGVRDSWDSAELDENMFDETENEFGEEDE